VSFYGAKKLVVGCASTGAKFTPVNHRPTGEVLIDTICSGATIKASTVRLAAEAEALYGMGCRYYHYHARNPVTREQSTSNEIYKDVSLQIQNRCGELLLSFGASRNGAEVRASIARFGEWERISQCGIPLHLGGAHFVTMQAAAELQIICDLERKLNRDLTARYVDSEAFRDAVLAHRPGREELDASLEAYTTSAGSDYGRTSPAIQFQVYGNAIAARERLGLFHEIEWVQLQRSHAMTRYAVEHPAMTLGSSGQLNITLLFGFSPRLPFPDDYADFRRVVRLAKGLEYDVAEPGLRKRKVSIAVGAAVMPLDASNHFHELDVGPEKGRRVCALRRLAAYAAQPDSEVDVFRVGMEDTPYAVAGDGALTVADNCDLFAIALDELGRNGAQVETDAAVIRERLGLDSVQRRVLDEQRAMPLGGDLQRRNGASSLQHA
jgi:uncharacterized protein (DUF849 family)